MLLRLVLKTALEATVAAVVIGLEYFLVLLDLRVAIRLGFAVDPRISALFLTVDILVLMGFILIGFVFFFVLCVFWDC